MQKKELVWIFNLYNSFRIHTVKHEADSVTDNTGKTHPFVRQTVVKSGTIYGIDYGEYGDEANRALAVLFTMSKSTWDTISQNNTCGFLNSFAYTQGLCNGGYLSAKEAYYAAHKAWDIQMDKINGKLDRGVYGISAGEDGGVTEKLLSNVKEMSEINNGEMGVIIEKDPIVTLQHDNSKNKPLKRFVSEMRQYGLSTKNEALANFDFLVVYGFDLNHQNDLRINES